MAYSPIAFRPLGLLCALALSAPALADRVALPSDGSYGERYPLSLTGLADWRASGGSPGTAFGKSSGLRAAPALALPPGTVVESVIAVPPLPAHEARWRERFGVVALDLSGVQGPGTGACTLEVLDEAGTVLGSARVATDRPHLGGGGWSCDSEDSSEPLTDALDGKMDSLWHSNWHQPSPLPHHLQWNATEAAAITGFVYTPRQNWRTGMVKDWELLASDDGAAWRKVAAGTFEYPGQSLAAKTVLLDKPTSARAFRFVAKSEAENRGSAASAAEFRFLGADGQPIVPKPAVAADHAPNRTDRAWVCLAPETVAKLTPPTLDKGGEGAPPPKAPPDAKKLRLRVTSTGSGTAVVAGIAFCRPPVKAERGMEVKGNSYGPYGPDYVALGLLGIQGQVEHGEIGTPLLAPFPDSPAAKAGLQNGDYLVAVEGVPLRPHFGHQTMAWLEDGHQAALGRAAVDALRADAKNPRQLNLTLLRAGQLVRVDLRLPDDAPLWQPDAPASADAMRWTGPATGDPIWAALERDALAKTVAMCRPDGSFATDGIDYIQVSLIGLALLQTKDPRHAERIVRCADWCLKQPDLMNQWYWKVGYNGIFLAEYYLATGDERVRPWLENAVAWLPLSTHLGSNSGHMQAPGHGPEGLPYDNKGLLAPALHALLFEALAKHAGIQTPARDFEAQLHAYIEHSYAAPSRGGDALVDYSPSGKPPVAIAGASESWARTGLYHAAMRLRGPWPDGAVAGATLNARSHRIYGAHAYGMPGALWGMVGLAGCSPKDFDAVMRRHAWDFLTAWQPGFGMRVSMPLMGQPYMGQEGLNNPGWLMALGARRHVLHCCGGTERNWLDISKVPMRAGELRANVAVDGHNFLECSPTGAPVRYSRDGSAPLASAPAGSGPDLDLGGVVLAQAFDRLEKPDARSWWQRKTAGAPAPAPAKPVGAPTWLVVPESKLRWKVLEATGWADPAESLARAQLAIDNKTGTEWMTNAGEARQPFPHRLVVDTGRVRLLHGLALCRINLGDFTLSASLDGATWTKVKDFHLTKANQADGNHLVTEIFDGPPQKARYLRLDIRATATLPAQPGQPEPKGDPSLFFGELDVLEPTPNLSVKNGAAQVTAPAGFAVVFTTDGKPALANGKRLPLDKANAAQVPLKKGQVLRARCVKDGWSGPETVVEGK